MEILCDDEETTSRYNYRAFAGSIPGCHMYFGVWMKRGKLLVEVRLAAQCTDARVNIVVQDLYAKYPTVAALAEAKPEDVEAIVRPCGLGRSKAKDICACMKVLHEKYQDNVPDDFDALLALPGRWKKECEPGSWAMCSVNLRS